MITVLNTLPIAIDATTPIAPNQGMAGVHLPLAPALQVWLGGLFAALDRNNHRWVVLRGGDALPTSAGFDLDILVAESAVDDLFTNDAEPTENVVVVSRRKVRGGKIAVFVVAPPGASRNWLVLDIQVGVTAAGMQDISAADVGLRRVSRGGMQLALPDDAARARLLEMHRTRKNALARSSRETFRLRESAGRMLFFRAPFVHRHRPLFFALCGPDGVGKSTVLSLMLNILNSYPLDVRALHHTTHVKEVERRSWAEAEAGPDGPTRSLGFRGLRAVWRRFVPSRLKAVILAIRSAISYVLRLNRAIGEDFFGGRITLMDRYVYDRCVKSSLVPSGALIGAVQAAARLMRPPRLTFAVTDEPERVFARKQELDLAQIAEYGPRLMALCCGLKAPCRELRVDRRFPEPVAAEAVTALLKACGGDLFDIIGHYEARRA